MLKNATWLFIITSVILVIFLPSYTKMQDLRHKNFEYGREIQSLRRSNKKLSEEKKLLEDDPIYLEKVAREKMGLVREGEMVFKITPVNKKKE